MIGLRSKTPRKGKQVSWNNGYVSDIEYPAGFFPEQSPVHLNLACLMNGVEPVALDAPFTYCELGCGRGLTSIALAATHPHGQFYACDFNPAHMAEARELADAAGLENVTVLENSFADLSSGAVDLPMFDFVTMYGVYGWVNDENRGHIVDFLARRVKPGGVVYLNYNAMPGWAAVHPLQRLLLEIAEANVGTRTQRCDQARQMIDRLTTLQARYFVDNASLDMQRRLDSIRNDEAGYLAHEYMNKGWRPLYHANVTRQLAWAGLQYIGSTELFRSFPSLYLPPEHVELFEQTPQALRETVADYLANTSFRDDVYVRNAIQLSADRQSEWMQRIGLALIVPRSLVKHKIKLANGELVDREDLYKPVLDALEQAPLTLAELATVPAIRREGATAAFQVAALLISSEQASAYHVCDDAGNDSAYRLNRVMASMPHYHSANHVLVSPVLGNGLLTSVAAQLVYRVLCEMGDAADTDVLTNRVLHIMEGESHLQGENAQCSRPDAEDRDAASQKIHRILEKLVPVWRQLKIL
jgi:SAM-dependent methyltransferase